MSEKCGKCGKTAYPTEKVNSIGKAWHKACFKCTQCNSSLQLGSEAAHEGKPYCKRCHQSAFGPGGYGFGQGGTLSSHSWNTTVHGGTPIAEPPKVENKASEATNFCGECGFRNAGAGFCSNCGSKLE
ncbi:cysteine-rich protein 1-like [Planoprotostelium fungivorum]|uniref:Cysteine-rich protein 1 n=1 Tax=Planoprotostelium fungivorum TaxID=1890364 RepID=A0A2P6NUY1_9EUKA|nr:cysteine-rich protein 1-like [Planoprotostelium fungivorum]